MSAFNYNISTTGNCSPSQYGAISLSLNGGTPPYIVQWVSPISYTDIITTQPSVLTGLIAGTYSVRVNDSTLPTNSSFYINIPVSSGVCCTILNVFSTTCNQSNGSVTGTSSSNYSTTNFYLYDSGGTFSQSAITNTSTVVFGSLSAGTYYMVAEDIGGCTGRSQNFIVEGSTEMDFGLYVVPNSSCGIGAIGKLYITGQTGLAPFTYVWSNGTTGTTLTGLTSGTYSVQATDDLGCSKTHSATITNVPPLGFGIFTTTSPTCFKNDGVLSITITGGTAPYYYSASTGSIEISYSQTYTMSGLSAGPYGFLVTDAALCSIVVGTTLNTPGGINSAFVTSQGSYCSSTNGSITMSVVGGTSPYTYTLIYPDSSTVNVTSNQTSHVFPNLSTGLYSIAVEDATACGYIQEVYLMATDTFTISTQTTGTTCSQNNGYINVIKSSGGTSPFNYSLDNSINVLNTNLSAVTFTNVASGQHTISVSDATGCTQTTQVYVGGSSLVDYTLYTTSCGAGDNGTITAFISSGTPPFTYDWSSNISGNPQQIQVSGLTGGTYSLTITDYNGCSLKRSVDITCDGTFISYQTYVMGCELFQIQSPTKYGLLQMLNEGFQDITSGNTSCELITASFDVRILVEPSGFDTGLVNIFTTSSLGVAPPDNLYYNEVETLLHTIPGVGQVIIDSLNNTITIETIKNNTSLNGQEIKIELIITYNIICLS